MNTNVTIEVYSDLGTLEIYRMMQGALNKFDYVVDKFSRFDKNSELSKLNDRKTDSVDVSKEMLYLVKTILNISKTSRGKLDPTIIDILESYGFSSKKDFTALNHPKKLAMELATLMHDRPQIDQIVVNNELTNITFAKSQRIDLGAIGKGYAIDLAKKYLQDNGISNFLINAGGDIYASGKKNGVDQWEVGLSIPGNTTDVFGHVTIENMSITSSGTWANKYKQFNHLININTGRSVQDNIQVFVVHKQAILADGYATMLALMGADGLEILENKKIGGLIIHNDKLIFNNKFPKFD